MGLLPDDAIVMHPGPMNRGMEIAAEVADDPRRSTIVEQVANGVSRADGRAVPAARRLAEAVGELMTHVADQGRARRTARTPPTCCSGRR